MVGSAVDTVVKSSAERKDDTHSAENTRKKWTRAVSLFLIVPPAELSKLDRGVGDVVEEEIWCRCAVDVCSERVGYCGKTGDECEW